MNSRVHREGTRRIVRQKLIKLNVTSVEKLLIGLITMMDSSQLIGKKFEVGWNT